MIGTQRHIIFDLKIKLRKMLYGQESIGAIVNDFLLGANIFIIMLSVILLFYNKLSWAIYVEVFFGALFAVEFLIRLWISRHRLRFVFHPASILDIVVIVSLIVPVFIQNLAFLRIARTLQILRTYKLPDRRFNKENSFLQRNKEIVMSVGNIIVFLFVMTSIVFIYQAESNPYINTYFDAVYFTVTTLTTTGFGDITPVGNTGRVLALAIMLFGVSLFVRLAKNIFVPKKLYSVCSDCGLGRHDLDASHCKRCGHIIANKYYNSENN